MSCYNYTFIQVLVAAAIICISIILTIYFIIKLGKRWDYASILPGLIICVVGIYICFYILHPPGSENALCWEAEKIRDNTRHYTMLEKDKEYQERKEREIQEIMAKLKQK